MMFDFVCKNNCNELGDSSKNQVSMQCFLILSTTSCKTEIVFYVIDISFYCGSDFVSVIPLFGSANGSGIGTKTNVI